MAGKVVLTTGAFDMLHPGHVKLLEEAKKLAGSDGKLVVLIARDETVRRNGGIRSSMRSLGDTWSPCSSPLMR